MEFYLNSPAEILSRQRAALPEQSGARAFFVMKFSFEQRYLPENPMILLAAAIELVRNADSISVRACVCERIEELQELAAQKNLDAVAEKLQLAVLDFSQPWRLSPVHVAKPWGQEIWLTGIEARGLSLVESSTGTTPLPYALALDTEAVLGDREQPILLKVLDPLPDAVYGDLYFELHEQKQEVYIVTHINRVAWPDGNGAIRFGFSASKRALYPSDTAFLDDYRRAVERYQKIRRRIDTQTDLFRQRDDIGLNDAVSAKQMKIWLDELPPELLMEECDLRTQMDSFTALKTLRVGDVLPVPCFAPHALQHGVRTVEFQTPTYERKILSFAQKVLTQTDWDTDSALSMVDMQTQEPAPFPVLLDANGVHIEQIVCFSDFEVWRCVMAPNSFYESQTNGHHWLIMTVTGKVYCADILLEAEQASLIPVCAGAIQLRNSGATHATVLLAKPV